MSRRNTERKTGQPVDQILSNPSAVGEDENIMTSFFTTNFSVLYIRYKIPTSSRLQESMVLLDPAESLAHAFQFVIAASRPPTQLRSISGTNPELELEPEQKQRRDRLRALAMENVKLASWDMAPQQQSLTE